MSNGPITCQFCHEDTEEPITISVNVVGENNSIKLIMCEECERTGRAPGKTVTETVKELILSGVRKWTRGIIP